MKMLEYEKMGNKVPEGVNSPSTPTPTLSNTWSPPVNSRKRKRRKSRFADFCCKIASIFCCPPTRTSIVRKLAFHPPVPSQYCLVEDKTAEFGLRIKANKPKLLRVYPDFEECCKQAEIFNVKKKDGNLLAGLRVRCPVLNKPKRGQRSPDTRVTVFYSHPNAVDLADVLPYAVDFSKTFFCDFISYDYTGYGQNLGEPSEAQILCDAECVFQHVRVQLKTNLRRLILFGESIGSVPSIHLATRYKVRGLILQGALASGIKVFFPFVDANPFGIDCFRNIERVSNVHTGAIEVGKRLIFTELENQDVSYVRFFLSTAHTMKSATSKPLKKCTKSALVP
ncbi:protein ABHD17B-like isoform X2 [Varroa destructor]|uniref:Serine aminopeptidase S33 domain-containing protein n=1 Tax=Varroa destructor TaxID=109461 RepID=A0A7M7MEC8_VARDE|nr:protein ABHD17B-like isoform X2 [Varroa destructor]